MCCDPCWSDPSSHHIWVHRSDHPSSSASRRSSPLERGSSSVWTPHWWSWWRRRSSLRCSSTKRRQTTNLSGARTCPLVFHASPSLTFTHKAVLFAFSVSTALREGLLDVSTVELHILFLQQVVELPQECDTHWNRGSSSHSAIMSTSLSGPCRCLLASPREEREAKAKLTAARTGP